MKKICIVASKYYEDVINMLVSGANDVLNNHKKKIKSGKKTGKYHDFYFKSS